MVKCLHPRARAIQRSKINLRSGKPQSTVAVAAYLNRMNLKQEEGRVLEEYRYDFSLNTPECVVARGIIAPECAPGYLKEVDPSEGELYRAVTQRLWNDAEHAGTRVNAINGMEWMLPLPTELALDQNEALVRGFCKDYFVKRGMVVQYAIHQPNPWNDPRNIHAHVLATDRDISESGFAQRKSEACREWHHPSLVRDSHQAWEVACNIALHQANCLEVVIDNRRNDVQLLRALEDGDLARVRELNHVPGVHLGKAVIEMEARGIESYKHEHLSQAKQREWEEAVKPALREAASIGEELTRRIARVVEFKQKEEETLREKIQAELRRQEEQKFERARTDRAYLDKLIAAHNDRVASLVSASMADAKRAIIEAQKPMVEKMEALEAKIEKEAQRRQFIRAQLDTLGGKIARMVDRSKRQDYQSDLAGIDTRKRQYEKERGELLEGYRRGLGKEKITREAQRIVAARHPEVVRQGQRLELTSQEWSQRNRQRIQQKLEHERQGRGIRRRASGIALAKRLGTHKGPSQGSKNQLQSALEEQIEHGEKSPKKSIRWHY